MSAPTPRDPALRCWRCSDAGEYEVARFINGAWTTAMKPCRSCRITLTETSDADR